MNQSRLICLSLTPNLRCAGFTLGQFAALIIPPAIEVIISLLFIYLYSGPTRRSQILLAADGILYFIWVLLDMLSHVVPAARSSLSVFKVFNFLVGAVSFTPILIYSIYLYRLSFQYFIPTLPRKLQPYLEILLPILLVIAVALNEVSSFVGTHLGTSSSQLPVTSNEFLWLFFSRSSLTTFTIIQFLFFLLAFSRLSRAFLVQRRIELANSDDHHCLHGIAWITSGIILGVIETIAGFAQVGFGLVLARRLLRLTSRVTLMFGLLKGLDVAQTLENLMDESRSVSRIRKSISRILGVDLQQTHMFRRMSQSFSEKYGGDEFSSAEKQPREQRVTVHYEKGQAPFLQIRFSTLEFPAQAILADTVQQRRLSEIYLGRANTCSSAQRHGVGMVTTENAAPRRPRAKSAPTTENGHGVTPEWIWPPPGGFIRPESGVTISDNNSIVRDLERRFPNLPPRVTGKYRGSILGENYEEDPFPVVGVSRQSSMRRNEDAHNLSEEGNTSCTLLRSNSSIRRKPAPPLLGNIAYVSDQRKRKPSTWGGLAQNTSDNPVVFPVAPNGHWEGSTLCTSDLTLAAEPSTPKSRKATARDLIKRASRALSDASIRSAEWLASAGLPQTPQALTIADIEMYRRGDLGPGPTRPTPGVRDVSLPGDDLTTASRRH